MNGKNGTEKSVLFVAPDIDGFVSFVSFDEK